MRPSLRIPHLPVPGRRGSVLIVVFVVILFLTLAAYTYTQTMITELEASAIQGLDAQTRAAADSGVEYAATLLANRAEPGLENLLHNPQLFHGVTVINSDRARSRVRFSLIAPLEQDISGQRIRYGLMDESGKLNLNILGQLQLTDDEARTLLMGVPGMTEDIADAIRDWIDSDDEMLPYGAETADTYAAMSPPYSAKNGPLESIDELLMVRGVTPQLLYGEDANRNGLLDPNENDAEASPPLDNADGLLDPGWVAFFTVHSRESNLRSDGTPKIDLSNGILTDLYDSLEEEFNEDVAKYVVAYRINGPKPEDTDGVSGGGPAAPGTGTPSSGSSSSGKSSSSSSSSSGKSSSSSSSGGSSSGRSATTSTNSSTQQTQQSQAVAGLASAVAGAVASGGQVTRGGMDLSKGGPTKIKSIYDLVDAEVEATIDGAKQTLTSPWRSDSGGLSSILPDLFNKLSVSGDAYVEGRININQARREILIGIPGMPEELADAIVSSQQVSADGAPLTDAIQRRGTTGWLLDDRLTDLATLRAIDPFVTARGDVYRIQVLGYSDGGGPVARLEAVIDATQIPPRIVFQRELDGLGRGYGKQFLTPLATN